MGIVDNGYGLKRIKGKTGWIPTESNRITEYKPVEPPLEYMLKQESRGEIGDPKVSNLNVKDDERYRKRVKSRERMWQKRYRGRKRDAKCNEKRIDRKRRKYGRIPEYAL